MTFLVNLKKKKSLKQPNLKYLKAVPRKIKPKIIYVAFLMGLTIPNAFIRPVGRFLQFTANFSIKRYNLLSAKVLNAIHSYTGYNNVIIRGKSIQKHKNYLLDFYSKNLYNSVEKRLQGFLASLPKEIPLSFQEFLFKFPFYYQKKYKQLLQDIYYYYSLPYQDFKNKYKLLKESFNIFYEKMGGHFFKAFKDYKILIHKLFKYNFLDVVGIKIIFKGRFGKVRKQIEKLIVGSLSLSSIQQVVIYFKSLLVTTRGSYGFHIWFAQNKQLGLNPKPAGKLVKNNPERMMYDDKDDEIND